MDKEPLDEEVESEKPGLIIPIYSSRLIRERTLSFAKREKINTPGKLAKLLKAYFILHDREEFIICFLDTAMTLTGMCSVSVGGLSQSVVEPRAVFKAAILANASCLIAAHNHPSGNPEPSREDIHITKQLVKAGKLLAIPVRDHLILGDDDYVSLAERGFV